MGLEKNFPSKISKDLSLKKNLWEEEFERGKWKGKGVSERKKKIERKEKKTSQNRGFDPFYSTIWVMRVPSGLKTCAVSGEENCFRES